MMFYLLSLLTGVLECGWIAFGAIHAFPFWQILCYPLAYHFGNLFPKPFSLNRKCLIAMCILSILTGNLSFFSGFSETTVFVLNCVSLFLLSATIQSVRGEMKRDDNRLLKRVFRIGGFALAPLVAVVPIIAFVILNLSPVIVLLALKKYNKKAQIMKLTGQNGFSAIMLFHQLHYFFYAHIILAAISLLFVKDFSVVGTVIGAFLFCGTWITYMSVEPVISSKTDKLLPVFYAGHIGISLLLFTMGFVHNRIVFLALWLITGFGGGVVYTISATAKVIGTYNKDSMAISENIGHTLGLFTATIIAALFGTKSPQIMLIFGSISATFARL